MDMSVLLSVFFCVAVCVAQQPPGFPVRAGPIIPTGTSVITGPGLNPGIVITQPGFQPGPVSPQMMGPFISPSSPAEVLMRRFAMNPNNYRYATCVFNETWSPLRGRVDMRQFLIGEGSQQVTVRIQLSGLPQSVGEIERAIHVHEFGDIGDGCARVGPHFNPNQTPHGSRRNFAFLRHVGNLGNILQSQEGIVSTQFLDSVISLEGVNSIVGRAIAIKFERDDQGLGGTRDSQVNGNTHTPLACCTIGRTTARNWYNPLSALDLQNMAATGVMPYYTVNQNMQGGNMNMVNMAGQQGTMQFGAGSFTPGSAPGQTFNFATQG